MNPYPNSSDSTNNLDSGSNSLRVRFRMVTHQSSHQFRARISTTCSSMTSLSSTPSLTHPHLMLDNTELNNQNESFYLYNQDVQSIPIKTEVKKHTLRTFKLTEDLKSNIKFDVSLKPSLSIRDDRLSASSSRYNSRQNLALNTSFPGSGFCSRSSSFDKSNVKRIEVDREEEIELPIRSSSSARGTLNDLPYRTNVPLNSSITFKIKNLNRCDDSNASFSSNKSSSRVHSPFTFIETVSTRRQTTSSPFFIDKARLIYFFFVCIKLLNYLKNSRPLLIFLNFYNPEPSIFKLNFFFF